MIDVQVNSIFLKDTYLLMLLACESLSFVSSLAAIGVTGLSKQLSLDAALSYILSITPGKWKE